MLLGGGGGPLAPSLVPIAQPAYHETFGLASVRWRQRLALLLLFSFDLAVADEDGVHKAAAVFGGKFRPEIALLSVPVLMVLLYGESWRLGPVMVSSAAFRVEK